MSSTEFRRLLEEGDVEGLTSLWANDMPHLPKPQSKHDAEIMMHYARTEAESITFRKRAYSHKWLLERNYPSALPNELRPKADRIYSKSAEAVGISVNTKNEFLKPAMAMIQHEMSIAVEDVYANGDQADIELVKRRMKEAKIKESIRLFGRFKHK